MNLQVSALTKRGWPVFFVCLLVGARLTGQNAPSSALPGGGGSPLSLIRPAGVKIEGMTPETEAFLRRLGTGYFQAKSYRDAGRIVLVQHQGRVKTTTETPMELSFRRPNRLRLETGQYSAICDGKTLLFSVPSTNQHTPQPAPDTLLRRHLAAGSVFGGVEEGHPEVLDLLTASDAIETLLARMTRITSRTKGTRRTLVYETMGRTRITLTVDAERMVIVSAAGETMPAQPGPKDPTVPDAITLRCDFGTVALDSKIPDSHFKVPPPEAATRTPGPPVVGKPGSASPETDHLVGRPLPVLTRTTDLGGAVFEPAELKGKVALLFFWSSDGGEHSLKGITLVQQLAERFRNQSEVVILGVVTDSEPQPLAGQLLERKKARFRCLTDTQANWRQAFRLAGLPTFVLVDRAGVVRWALLGAPPDLQDQLAKEIDLALAAVPKK